MNAQTSFSSKEIQAASSDQYLNGLLKQCQGQTVALQDSETATWLQQVRDHASSSLAQSSMPTKRDEEWRFTDLSPLMQHDFQADGEASVAPSTVEGLTLPEASTTRLVFVNGVYSHQLSDVTDLPKGVYVGNLSCMSAAHTSRLQNYLAQQEGSEELFTALNTASLTDAAVIWAAPNQIVETPIHLLFLSVPGETPTLSQPRALVVAHTSASLEVIEQYTSLSESENRPNTGELPARQGELPARPYLTNAVTEIWAEENAQVTHTRVQQESQQGFHIGKSAITQSRDSRYTCNAISFGARLSRHKLDVFCHGSQSDTNLNGLTVIRGEQLSDTHSAIAYTTPHCTSDQLHKCIIDDRAHAVFNGKVFVPKAAQLTNAAQLNRNLLLSPKAHVNTKPQLQITADNVQCSHGATVSQLEADELFYLRSRGLNESDARNLLIDAFAAEMLQRIPTPSLRKTLSASLREGRGQKAEGRG